MARWPFPRKKTPTPTPQMTGSDASSLEKSTQAAAVHTFSSEQVAALLASTQLGAGTTGSFSPLPRIEPMVAFGPGMPLLPTAFDPVNPETGRTPPRFSEYPVSVNLPGITDRLVPWKVLRDSAEVGLPRRCIEIRKSHVVSLEWAIVISKDAIAQAQAANPSAPRAEIEADLRRSLGSEIARCTAFWSRPDPGQDEEWPEWISKLLEEQLVLDAIAIYPRRTRGGGLYALEIVDGSTIKVLRDHRGGKPLPPNPAYQQLLWGFPRGEYTADTDDDQNILNPYDDDTLIYKRRNVRSFTPYGFSAVEQCLTDLDVWLQRRNWIRSEYTDGTVPTGFLKMSSDAVGWTPAQVREYETAINDMWSGQHADRHRMRMLPPGIDLATNSDVAERYKPEYDLFLIRLLSSHFGVTLPELNFSEPGGLGSTGYHEGQADVQERSSTMPDYRWLQKLITSISHRHLHMAPQLEFKILGLEDEDDAAADAVAQERVQWGRTTLNEDRDLRGLPRYPFPEADMPMLMTQRGVVFLEGAARLAPSGETVGPVQAPPATDEDGDGIIDRFEDPDALAGDEDDGARDQAVKTELAAYRRWARRNPRPSRPFTFNTVTKADAPALQGAPVVFAAGGGPDPKAGSPAVWPGWGRDTATAAAWAPRITQALAGALDWNALAAAWITHIHLAKADDWDLAQASAWLTGQGIDLNPVITDLVLGLRTEGWAIGSTAATAAVAGESTATFNWTPGDEAAATHTLTATNRHDLAAHQEQAVSQAREIATNRLRRLAQALAEAKNTGLTASQLADELRAAIADAPWARMLALTELLHGQSAATTSTYQGAGVSSVQWTCEDEPCTACLDNEDAGSLQLGQAFPSGVTAPPQHPSCRCSLLPA
ncbi:phage portal protein [Streptomyces sp. NRRL S-350]|uniref:phage portal protein n=1 Tax=Streptomyces sp. NRRL S-350 TaxID=1463902 RepID=UPI001F47EEC2|nr:phage portal protein [Streptomyces sp. NRRL S-350]